MNKRYFLFILLSCFLCRVSAQPTNLIFKNINRATGLPVDEVSNLAQDSSGFIWIGSREGLFRYDGFNYISYYYSPGKNASIPGNYISKIHVDKTGLLWVGTLGGVVVMNDKGKRLDIFNSLSTTLFSKESDAVFDIQEDKNSIWISTSDGLFQVNKKYHDIAHTKRIDLKKNFHFSTNQLGLFNIDNSGRLWLCTLHGLAIYDPLTGKLFHKENNPEGLSILNEKSAFRSLSLDENNETVMYSIWEPAVRTFNRRDNKSNTIYSGKDSRNPDYGSLINQALKDDHGKLWIANGHGIRIIDKNNEEQVISYAPENFYGIRSNQVKSLLQDREGSIWLGTSEGISITRPYESNVVNLSVNNPGKYPFAAEEVNQIIPVNANTILVATRLGIFRTDSLFNAMEHYSFGTNKYDWSWNYYRHRDKIYISTQGGNLLYDVKTAQLNKLTEPPFDKFFPVFSFVAGSDSSFWMSQYQDNFMQYNPFTKKYKVYNLPAMCEQSSIVQLARDREKNLWVISSSGGVFKFDEKREKITDRLTVNNNGLRENNILFLEDVGNDLLIGYVSKGISLYNKKTRTFKHYSKSDGLVSNSVIAALQVDDNTVWIATRNGLSRFNLSTRSFKNLNFDNGILQNDFQCLTKLPGGRIAAGTLKGLLYFYPEKITVREKLFAPVITGINVHGDELPTDSFNSTHPLHISYNKNYFSIDYICPQYINNQQIEYAYMLDGFNKTWMTAGNRRFASYSNVDGGKYTLRVKARYAGGEWIESPKGLPVIVHTAFYKSVWFYAACALLLALVMYGIFWYRLRQVMRMEKMRTSISSDLHDEVGASLTSISIFSEMAKQSLSSTPRAEQYLQRIGDRSRESIEKMSDIIWSINPENDSLQQMLIRMKNFVNEIVEGKEITVHWEEDVSVAGLKLGMDERKNFYLLFKEAVINAVKYSEAKNIKVGISMQGKVVQLQVIDDGKGFDFEKIKAGNGIKNIRHRAIQLHGQADIISSPGKGTSVSVEFNH
jgi:ligand-binding sensor domain-containing protein/two-component sensor histidine kinase